MVTYFVTFGQQYRHEPHPVLRSAHPDGWFEVRGAVDEMEARVVVAALLGTAWSFIYTAADFPRRLFPRGCVATLNLC